MTRENNKMKTFLKKPTAKLYPAFVYLLYICTLFSQSAYAATVLENGTALTNIATTSNALYYTLDVPSGASNLSFFMSGGTGDGDLYVKFGSAPTTSSYDCRPYAGGNDESCPISDAQPGTYHVMISPYAAFTGVSLLASYTDDSGGNGGGGTGGGAELNESNLSGATGSNTYFTLDVPSGASNLSFNMSSGAGDADLFVRFGAQPTSSTYDCRPYQSGNNEACDIANVQTGTYHVMLNAYSAYTGVALSGTYDVDAGGNTSPQAVIANGPFSTLEGANILMSSAGSADSDGSISSYAWSFGDGSNSSSASPSHSYTSAGNYTVTLTVTDNEGAVASINTSATIASPANQSPTAFIANGPFSANTGQAISMSSNGSNDPDGNIASYAWNFGDGGSSNSANPTYTYASAGNFNITLTVTDNEGAASSASSSAFVSEVANSAPQATIANGPFSALENTSISMSSNGSNDSDGTIASYAWNFGDGNSSSSTNPSHSYATAGTYTVALTVTDNDGANASASTTATITAENTGGGSDLNESGLTGSANSTQSFTLDVPAGASNLVFAMSGGSGDADLYVRFGSTPTTSTYDCRPYVGGNTETCSISNVQTGTYYVMVRAYATFSGVNLTGTYDGGSTGGNTSPEAIIANGPFSSLTSANIAMSSAGSNDPDGSIASYQWSFGDGATSTSANPSHSYAAAGSYTVQLTVTDNDGASDTASTNAVLTAAGSGFTATSHYYDKGDFDFNYTNYETAFSDNFTDSDVEIHAYIVINFNENVKSSTINANNISVKRLNMADNVENNQNNISGEFELISSKQAIFKPNVEYYTNEGGSFDWNNPNWNGLKPNYEYSVELSSAIKNTSNENLDANAQSTWVFETIDNDYGLYWFKNGTSAMKYVPGRTIPSEYYNPSKPTHIYGHGWGKTSVHVQDGGLRDYRREPMMVKPGPMYPAQEAVDLIEIWKDPSKNYQGKAWNYGIVYWNQFADDDYANLSKPQKAEAKIWSTEGKNNMSYAIRKWNGVSWSQDHVETHAPMKPVTVILADAFIAATQNASNSELRFSGNSLGNQIITGISYVLKKEYAEGRIGANQFPKRLALLDPYWRGGALQNDWTMNHPAYVDLGESNDSSGEMTFKIVTDMIDFADNDPNVSFVLEHYDTSRTTDGSTFGQSYGDRNSDQRDVGAIIYQQASWISGSESSTNYLAHRHVFGRYWYQWQYAFAPPVSGFSASSSDADIRANMNYYKSTKIRYSINAGGNTPTPIDDNYELKTGSSWQQ
jgi:PKD repeat protein